MRTPGFCDDLVVPFLPIRSLGPIVPTRPPVKFPDPQPGDGQDQAACRSVCEAQLTACVAPLAVFFPFAIPACYAAHDSCLAKCNFGTLVNY